MNIKESVQNKIKELDEVGTSEGVRKAWVTRRKHFQKWVNIASKKAGLPGNPPRVILSPRHPMVKGSYGWKDPSVPMIRIFSGSGKHAYQWRKSKRAFKTLQHEFAHHLGRTKGLYFKHGTEGEKSFKKLITLTKALRKHKVYEAGTSEGVRKSWETRKRYGISRRRGVLRPGAKTIAIRLTTGKILKGKSSQIHADIVAKYSKLIGNKLKSAGFVDKRGRYTRSYSY